MAGNWKMHPASAAEAVELATAVAAATSAARVDVVVCPPFTWLAEVRAALATSAVGIGAQTMHPDERGPFTGEVSPLMLRDLATYVILGHSERRLYAGETDADVGRKVASAVAHGLRPIAAIGERRNERQAGSTLAVLERQLRAAVGGLDRIAGSGLSIAYEPVWAIGTGDAASPADAQAGAFFIRGLLAEIDSDGSREVRILYGGSVDPDNAADFFRQPDVDGALVGGASLQPATFAAIVRAAALA